MTKDLSHNVNNSFHRLWTNTKRKAKNALTTCLASLMLTSSTLAIPVTVQVRDDIDDPIENALVVAYDNDIVVDSTRTDANGSAHLDIPTNNKPETEPAIPSQFTLHQNYPNPFNPGTKIPIEISTPGEIELSAYTIDGRLITKVEQDVVAGNHEWLFQAGSNMASGMYFLVVNYENRKDHYRKVLKMVYIKGTGSNNSINISHIGGGSRVTNVNSASNGEMKNNPKKTQTLDETYRLLITKNGYTAADSLVDIDGDTTLNAILKKYVNMQLNVEDNLGQEIFMNLQVTGDGVDTSNVTPFTLDSLFRGEYTVESETPDSTEGIFQNIQLLNDSNYVFLVQNLMRNINGNLSDDNENAVPGVHVRFIRNDEDPDSALTDDNGNFTRRLRIGNYTFTFAGNDTLGIVEEEVNIGDNLELNLITPNLLRDITGTVQDSTENNIGIPNIYLLFQREGDQLDSILTDENGEFNRRLKIGNYTFSFPGNETIGAFNYQRTIDGNEQFTFRTRSRKEVVIRISYPDGTGVNNLDVNITSDEHNENYTTNNNGEIQLNLFPNNYTASGTDNRIDDINDNFVVEHNTEIEINADERINFPNEINAECDEDNQLTLDLEEIATFGTGDGGSYLESLDENLVVEEGNTLAPLADTNGNMSFRAYFIGQYNTQRQQDYILVVNAVKDLLLIPISIDSTGYHPIINEEIEYTVDGEEHQVEGALRLQTGEGNIDLDVIAPNHYNSHLFAYLRSLNNLWDNNEENVTIPTTHKDIQTAAVLNLEGQEDDTVDVYLVKELDNVEYTDLESIMERLGGQTIMFKVNHIPVWIDEEHGEPTQATIDAFTNIIDAYNTLNLKRTYELVDEEPEGVHIFVWLDRMNPQNGPVTDEDGSIIQAMIRGPTTMGNHPKEVSEELFNVSGKADPEVGGLDVYAFYENGTPHGKGVYIAKVHNKAAPRTRW